MERKKTLFTIKAHKIFQSYFYNFKNFDLIYTITPRKRPKKKNFFYFFFWNEDKLIAFVRLKIN